MACFGPSVRRTMEPQKCTQFSRHHRVRASMRARHKQRSHRLSIFCPASRHSLSGTMFAMWCFLPAEELAACTWMFTFQNENAAFCSFALKEEVRPSFRVRKHRHSTQLLLFLANQRAERK